MKQVTRAGVYGVAMKDENILLVKQKRGPYTGKYDFPGGGLEFGESVEEALRREFLEEVAMAFDSSQFIDNLTTTVEVPSTLSSQSYVFYQIGMIYRIEGCRSIGGETADLEYFWKDIKTLAEDQCSNLLWKYIKCIEDNAYV